MTNLPEKFMIPEDRIPKPWSQFPWNCCPAASITKVLEVINYRKTGIYTMLSKGYMYGRNNAPNKKQGGMRYSYTIPKLLERGTVPEEMCPIMDEMPDIRTKIEALPNLKELDKEAEKTKIKNYVKIPGNVKFTETLKKYLYEYQMPMVGDLRGETHSVVVVGWDGDEFLYQDHNGRSTLYKDKLNEAYYLEGYFDEDKNPEMEGDCVNKNLPFEDVKKDDWYYKYVEKLYTEGIIQGVSEALFAPDKNLTRAEVCAIICRALYGME